VCANAGHPEPKLVRARTSPGAEPDIDSLGREGLALGILPEQDYEQRTYAFNTGDSLVMYTDGVVEARREGRLYGQYRLERRLAEEAGAGAPDIAFAVFEDCSRYAAGDLADDVAIVVAQRVATGEESHNQPEIAHA
jgi:serine phosphatase RsbU (regulator of sigma subunit)